jgi:hypothetical protein
MNLTAEQWNAIYPVGTPVRYFPVRMDHDRPATGDSESCVPIDSRTRSEAYNTHPGTTMVMLEGMAGGYSVRHLMPLLPPAKIRFQANDCLQHLEVEFPDGRIERALLDNAIAAALFHDIHDLEPGETQYWEGARDRSIIIAGRLGIEIPDRLQAEVRVEESDDGEG